MPGWSDSGQRTSLCILRKGIGVGRWSRKGQFSLTLCNETVLRQGVGGSKKPQITLTLYKDGPLVQVGISTSTKFYIVLGAVPYTFVLGCFHSFREQVSVCALSEIESTSYKIWDKRCVLIKVFTQNSNLSYFFSRSRWRLCDSFSDKKDLVKKKKKSSHQDGLFSSIEDSLVEELHPSEKALGKSIFPCFP